MINAILLLAAFWLDNACVCQRQHYNMLYRRFVFVYIEPEPESTPMCSVSGVHIQCPGSKDLHIF